jgi:hypothetical protein
VELEKDRKMRIESRIRRKDIREVMIATEGLEGG